MLMNEFYPLFPVFLLFQKILLSKDISEKTAETDETKTDFSRIRCPLCKWQPQKYSRWWCADAGFPEYFYEACGTSWNTFDTRGQCPGCAHQWRWTTCLRCGENSPHEDWYEEERKMEN
jgi:hypothetical protein